MTHVFVAPHPDDVALSCGGLIASLRELGQSARIDERLNASVFGQCAFVPKPSASRWYSVSSPSRSPVPE